MGARISRSEVWAKGGQGGTELAKKVLETIKSEKRKFASLYSEKKSIKDKINIIAKEIYGAGNVFFSKEAKGQMKMIERERLDKVPVCIAKTQFSLSDDPKKLGRPQNFTLNIREIRVSNGAGFIVAIAGEIMTMPGLPKSPAAERIDVDGEGRIKNLF